ncbi:MAG: hypothetical protein H7144_16800, partial [Burkholderiales bacterium]|nr:hypothetical protein [Phycisphaerae bacterium]
MSLPSSAPLTPRPDAAVHGAAGQPVLRSAPRSSRRSVGGIVAFVIIALLLGALVGLDVARRFVPMLIRDDLHAGDAAQHTWWLYRFADPELFPNDLAADYMSLLIYSPPAYQALFRVTAGLIDPQRMSESLAIALAVTSAVLAAAIGWRAGARAAPG